MSKEEHKAAAYGGSLVLKATTEDKAEYLIKCESDAKTIKACMASVRETKQQLRDAVLLRSKTSGFLRKGSLTKGDLKLKPGKWKELDKPEEAK